MRTDESAVRSSRAAMTVDPLEDAYPICAQCLRPRELDDGPAGLVWICDCGVTPAETS